MLSDLRVRKAKCPDDKSQIKISDAHGLYLLVLSSGGKYWRFDYRYNSKRKTLSIGVYPKVSLLEARHVHAEACRSLEQGIDPKFTLKRNKKNSDTFQDLYESWIENKKDELAEKTLKNIQSRIQRLVLPAIASIQVQELDTPTVLTILRHIEARGTIHTAHKIKSYIGQIMRFAIATGKASQDPTSALKGVLKSDKPQHRAAILDPQALGGLLRSIDIYTGANPVLHALQMLSQVFVRPGELRLAKWDEIDFEEKMWRIPEERMKVRDRGAHIVPLSSQVLHILINQKAGAKSDEDFIFPGMRPARPLSDNTLNMALRSLGYDGQTHVAHGFRATARSLLAEHGWPIPAIERQLAHAEKDRIAQAYARAEYLEIRTQMMQAWSDYLDDLKNNNKPSLRYQPQSSRANS